jgi:hypothetical protein
MALLRRELLLKPLVLLGLGLISIDWTGCYWCSIAIGSETNGLPSAFGNRITFCGNFWRTAESTTGR